MANEGLPLLSLTQIQFEFFFYLKIRFNKKKEGNNHKKKCSNTSPNPANDAQQVGFQSERIYSPSPKKKQKCITY